MSNKVKFHILSANWCPYCTKAKEAMMEYFQVDNMNGLRGHVVVYDVDEDKFDKKFGKLIPASYNTIPQIIVESSKGKYRFIGGYSDFMSKILKEE